jgi:hypothetical protein
MNLLLHTYTPQEYLDPDFALCLPFFCQLMQIKASPKGGGHIYVGTATPCPGASADEHST